MTAKAELPPVRGSYNAVRTRAGRRWHPVLVVLFLFACAGPAKLEFTTTTGIDTNPARAEAWAHDIESVTEMVGTGRALYEQDPVKMSAVDYCNLGNRLADGGELRLALRAKSKALYLAQEDNDAVLAAHCAAGVALAYDYARDMYHAGFWAEQAETFLARAYPHSADGRPVYVKTIALKVRADAALAAGSIGRASELMEQALKVSYQEYRPWLLLGMGNIAIAQHDAARATRYVQEALASGAPPLRPVANRLLGEIALDAGNPAEADALFAASGQAAQASGDDYALAWASRGRGQAANAQGHTAEAARMYEDAVAAANRARAIFHTEEFRSSTFGALSVVFDEAIETLLDAGQVENAFNVAEQSRARALTDMIRERAGAGTSHAATAVEIQRGLVRRPHTVLLSYHVLPKEIVLWTVRPDGLSGARLALGGAEAERLIRDFRDIITQGSGEGSAALQGQAASLWKTLVAPARLRDGETVVILPDGPLHYLPFGALRDTDWLLRRHALLFAPSAAAWLSTRQPISRAPRVLAVGNPVVPDRTFEDLSGAEAEVLAIKGELPETHVLTRAAATRADVIALSPQQDILHLATHAVFDKVDPLYSAVLLAAPSLEQGLLDAHSIYQLDLQNLRLVTLSACDTAMGRIARGDEYYGLVSAFLAAGVGDVAATLWPISDNSTPLLMVRFYHGLRQGLPVHEALRQAQIALIGDRRFGSPRFWAAFEVIGADQLP